MCYRTGIPSCMLEPVARTSSNGENPALESASVLCVAGWAVSRVVSEQGAPELKTRWGEDE